MDSFGFGYVDDPENEFSYLFVAGRVVGKRGVVITNLQRETRAKLMNALSPVGESLWIAVVIIGDWKSIIAAYKAVSEIVSGGWYQSPHSIYLNNWV